jgi:hypothetical protein
VDVVDAVTGRCLGRCQAKEVADGWYSPALAPDGRTLVRPRVGELVSTIEPGHGRRIAAHIWDLATGRQSDVIVFGRAPIKAVHWCGPRQFLGISIFHELIDLDAHAVACLYTAPKNYVPPREEHEEKEALRSDPSGRVWINVPNPQSKPVSSYQPQARRWQILSLPNPKGKVDGPLARPQDREFSFRPGVTIKVEVELGNYDRSLNAAQTLAAVLQAEGYAIGPDGWTLRITHEVVDTNQRLRWTPQDTQEYMDLSIPSRALDRFEKGKEGAVIPSVQVTTQLLDPAGAEGWRTTSKANFAMQASKYAVKTRSVTVNPGMMQSVSITTLDFKGQNPRTAIIEEILDKYASTRSLPPEIPRTLLKAEGQYRPLPLRCEFELNPMP